MTENEILQQIQILKQNIQDYHTSLDMLKRISKDKDCDTRCPIHIVDKLEMNLVDMRVKLAEVRGE